MATFTWTPDYGATESFEARVYEAKYGDGYTQRTPNGLNNLDVTLDLSFTLRTLVEVDAIADFLAAQKGATPFEWTPPGGTTYNYVCKTWKKVRQTNGDSSITATFERVYG